MERARAVKDLLVLLVIVALGARLIDASNDVVWPTAVILTSLGSFWPITTAVMMVTSIDEAAIIVASVVGAVVVAACRAMSARILVEAHLGFLGVGVLVGSRDHLADACGWLAIELGTKLTVMKSLDEGGDDLGFCDVRNRISHLGEASNVATEELEWLLGDAVEIMFGAWPCTHSHIVVGEDFLQLFPRSDGVRGEACEQVHRGWLEHDGKIVRHDTGISPGGSHICGINLYHCMGFIHPS